jgi:hypothetical protein
VKRQFRPNQDLAMPFRDGTEDPCSHRQTPDSLRGFAHRAGACLGEQGLRVRQESITNLVHQIRHEFAVGTLRIHKNVMRETASETSQPQIQILVGIRIATPYALQKRGPRNSAHVVRIGLAKGLVMEFALGTGAYSDS